MKTSLVVVSASLTIAIVLVAGFLIATQAHGQPVASLDRARCAAAGAITICEI
jgi:hypothetical protein